VADLIVGIIDKAAVALIAIFASLVDDFNHAVAADIVVVAVLHLPLVAVRNFLPIHDLKLPLAAHAFQLTAPVMVAATVPQNFHVISG
jgi:hypothetical protein